MLGPRPKTLGPGLSIRVPAMEVFIPPFVWLIIFLEFGLKCMKVSQKPFVKIVANKHHK